MCKIFATTLQDEAKDWFHTLSPRSLWNFSKLLLVFTKEYSSYRLIKKKFDQLFNMKNNSNETLRIYVKRFKIEKANIVGYNDRIASSTFRKRLPTDHPFFRKLIIGDNLTLAYSYTLADKHTL
ncbi:hypothetical protein ACFX2B_040232 [Malus domestica]